MKVWEWYFLVAIATCVLITTFFTQNIYISIGALALSIYLSKHSNKIPLPKQFRKHNIISGKTRKIYKVDIK
jgi:low affinity Fe/Cu permease